MDLRYIPHGYTDLQSLVICLDNGDIVAHMQSCGIVLTCTMRRNMQLCNDLFAVW